MYYGSYFSARDKPRFTVTPQTVTTSAGDSQITLRCQAEGNPQPVITWSRNGVVLGLSTRHYLERSGSLVIRPVQAEDYGTYRCDARNKYGRVSADAEVILNGKFQEPLLRSTVSPSDISYQRGH